MRRPLPPVGAIAWALVVVVLLVVLAVPLFAEVGMFECVNMGDMDAFSWFELVKLVCRIGGIANEVGESDGNGRCVLVSVNFVRVQRACSPTRVSLRESLTYVKATALMCDLHEFVVGELPE